MCPQEVSDYSTWVSSGENVVSTATDIKEGMGKKEEKREESVNDKEI